MRMSKTASFLLCGLMLTSAPLSFAHAEPIFLNKVKNIFGGSSNSQKQVAPLQQNRTQKASAKASSGGFDLDSYRDAQGRLPYEVARDRQKQEIRKSEMSRAALNQQIAAAEAREAAMQQQAGSLATQGGAVMAPNQGGAQQQYVQQPRIVIPQNQDSGGPKPIFKNYR
ncbi:MAG: hypothetical protein AB7E85_03570 [Pseudobdellovibrionaceae bacterium]